MHGISFSEVLLLKSTKMHGISLKDDILAMFGNNCIYFLLTGLEWVIEGVDGSLATEFNLNNKTTNYTIKPLFSIKYQPNEKTQQKECKR